MDKNILDDLLSNAWEARGNAYAPYSNFLVGCAILLNDGTIVRGVNVENASYPVVICAERAAIASVVAMGKIKDIKALAIATTASPPGSPCGMCRQVLGEFLENTTPIIFGNGKGESITTNIAELLPFAFKKSALLR